MLGKYSFNLFFLIVVICYFCYLSILYINVFSLKIEYILLVLGIVV